MPMHDLVEYYENKQLQMIIECDAANAHYTEWGSTNIKKCGECYERRRHLPPAEISKNIIVIGYTDVNKWLKEK